MFDGARVVFCQSDAEPKSSAASEAAAAAKALKLPATAPPSEIDSGCKAIEQQVDAADAPITGDVRTQALACGDYKAATTVASNRQASFRFELPEKTR